MKDLNKILSGNILIEIRNKLLTVKQPDAETRYLADFFADKVYQQAFEQNIYLQEEMEDLIVENGWWTQHQEEQLKQIPKDIEQIKVDYFNNFFKDSAKDFFKKAMRKKEQQFKKLTEEKYQFFNYTCESLQSQAYTMYILEHCTFYQNGEKISLDDISLQVLYSKYNSELLSDEDTREISKDAVWRMIWNSAKESREIFSVPACDYTSSQKSLISWTRMYDSVYESMETPSEDIIEDNYAIDGWFVVQRRKRDEDRKKSEADKFPDSAEVFVPVGSQKEAKNVHDMNTQHGKQQIKSRMKDLKNNGSLEEGDFSHVKQGNQMKANRQMFNRYKK